MADIQLDVTSREELQKSLRHLETKRPPYSESCASDLCYYVSFSNIWNGPVSTLLERVGRHGFGLPFYRALNLLGHRFLSFEARFRTRNGVISEYDYNLKVDDGSFGVPGFTTINVHAENSPDGLRLSDIFDESPEYRVSSYFKWPEKELGVGFSGLATKEQIHHAVDIQLGCLQSLQGCKDSRDILPRANQDRQQLLNSVERRLVSNEPCPERLIGPRFKNFPSVDVHLVEVVKVRDENTDEVSGSAYRTAVLQNLETLRGREDTSQKQIEEPLRIWRQVTRGIGNPVAGYLKPGARLLVFSSEDPRNATACMLIPASSAAMRAVREALRETKD